MSIYITPQDELHVEQQSIALTCPHCRTLDSPDAGRGSEVRGLEPAQAQADRHRVSLRCLRRADIPQVRGEELHGAAHRARAELHGDRARARGFPAELSAGGIRGLVQRGARLLRGGPLRRLRLHEPAHRAVAVPRARRARQARAVRYAAGNPQRSRSSTTTPSPTCAASCSAPIPIRGRITPDWMPSAPESCSR